MLVVRDGVEILMAAHFRAAVLIDDQVACDSVEQGTNVEHGQPGRLGAQHADVAFLGQIGRGIAVVDLAGQEVQQFAVVALQQGKTHVRLRKAGHPIAWRLAATGLRHTS